MGPTSRQQSYILQLVRLAEGQERWLALSLCSLQGTIKVLQGNIHQQYDLENYGATYTSLQHSAIPERGVFEILADAVNMREQSLTT